MIITRNRPAARNVPFRLKIYVPRARYARIRAPVGRRATLPDRSALVSPLNYLIKLIPPHTPHSRISENEPGGTRARTREFHLRETISCYCFVNTHHHDCTGGWIGALAMKMIGEGLLGEYRRGKIRRAT